MKFDIVLINYLTDNIYFYCLVSQGFDQFKKINFFNCIKRVHQKISTKINWKNHVKFKVTLRKTLLCTRFLN